MDEQPPSYDAATAESYANRPSEPIPRPHKTRNGIPPSSRRSMEDEARPLPPGWIRQYDFKNSHQFFVDSRASPPRSIWSHPYDDDEYLNTLDPQERARIRGLHRVPTIADIEAESSDDDHHGHHKSSPAAASSSGSEPKGGISRFGRKMKDKITSSTHEQREDSRRKRRDEEQRVYARHQAIRQAMSRAMETGQPQLVGKDRDGKDLYIEPPLPPGSGIGSGMGSGGFGGGSGYGGAYGGRGGYGYNPNFQGPYARTEGNATYVRPSYPYARPYGGGYGGGYGLPLAAGLGGGLLGGMLLGDMMGGGMGGGMGGDMMGGGMMGGGGMF